MYNQHNYNKNTTVTFQYLKHHSVLNRDPDFTSYLKKEIIFTNGKTCSYEDGMFTIKIHDKIINTFSVKRVLKFERNHGEAKKINRYKKIIIETDNISSEYWFTENGVFRYSDHWNLVKTCFWKINRNNKTNSDFKMIHTPAILGYAKWEDFKPFYADNKIYFEL